jgi:ribosome-binding protein aMBF1 (putative translation factor)
MPKSSFIDQLRQAINNSGMSRYRIAKTLGIGEATLSRFMSGERGLRLDVVEQLASLLKLRLVGENKSEKGR